MEKVRPGTGREAGLGHARSGEAGIQYLIRMRTAYVYIMASKRNGTLYIGVTTNLVKRVHEHKNDTVDGFTRKYIVHRLVYYETCTDIVSAITREKQLKKWDRKWKLELTGKTNPEWNDIYPELL